MHSPWFEISPYFRKNFGLRGKFSHFHLFRTEKNSDFHPQKFLMTFLVITCFLHTLHVFHFPSTLTIYLCITQCTYWTPLFESIVWLSTAICHHALLSSKYLCATQPAFDQDCYTAKSAELGQMIRKEEHAQTMNTSDIFNRCC